MKKNGKMREILMMQPKVEEGKVILEKMKPIPMVGKYMERLWDWRRNME